jgi:hypothetical protein
LFTINRKAAGRPNRLPEEPLPTADRSPARQNHRSRSDFNRRPIGDRLRDTIGPPVVEVAARNLAASSSKSRYNRRFSDRRSSTMAQGLLALQF